MTPAPEHGYDFKALLTSRAFVVAALLGLGSGVIAVPASGQGVYLVFAVLSPLAGTILFYVAWRYGRLFAAVAALFGAVYAMLMAGFGYAANYLLFFALPAALVIEYFYRRGAKSPGQGAIILISFAAVFVICLDLILSVFTDTELRAVVSRLLEVVSAQFIDAIQLSGGSPPAFDLEHMQRVFIPLVAAVWVFMTWAGLNLGAFLAALQGTTSLAMPDLTHIRGHLRILFLIVALGAVSLIGDGNLNWLAGNVAAILGLVLTFQGLGVVHVFVRSKIEAKWPLYIFYLFTLFTADISFILMAGLGVIDELADLRAKLQDGNQQGDGS